MKIAFVVPHFPPHFRGGTEAVALAHARGLAARGHDVRVIAGTDEPHAGTDVVHALVEGLAVSFLPRRAGEGFELLLERPRLAALAAREARGVDVVHVHGWHTLAGDLVRVLAREAPVVLTLHDHFATCPRGFRRSPEPDIACPPPGSFEACVRCLTLEAPGASSELAAALATRARSFQAEIAAAAAVLVPSRTHLVRLAQHLAFARGQVRLVAPGPCLELPARRRRPRAWDGEGRLRVLHAGRRSVEKGTFDLVRALAPLAGRVELVLAGGPVDARVDGELAALAGELPLSVSGDYDGADLARLAARCHLAALPSRLPESYSLALDEALLLGLPVWASNAEAGRERYQPPALEQLPAADPAAWRATFEELLARPALSREAFDAVPRARPDTAEALDALERVYEDALRSRRARPSA